MDELWLGVMRNGLIVILLLFNVRRNLASCMTRWEAIVMRGIWRIKYWQMYSGDRSERNDERLKYIFFLVLYSKNS